MKRLFTQKGRCTDQAANGDRPKEKTAPKTNARGGRAASGLREKLTCGAARMATKKPNQKMQAWIDACKRHRFSHAQAQMARELGMNPSKLGKLDNHDQEPWKMPLRQHIEHLYFKRFGRERPDVVLSVEQKIRLDEAKKARRREAKIKARQTGVAAEGQR